MGLTDWAGGNVERDPMQDIREIVPLRQGAVNIYIPPRPGSSSRLSAGAFRQIGKPTYVTITANKSGRIRITPSGDSITGTPVDVRHGLKHIATYANRFGFKSGTIPATYEIESRSLIVQLEREVTPEIY